MLIEVAVAVAAAGTAIAAAGGGIAGLWPADARSAAPAGCLMGWRLALGLSAALLLLLNANLWLSGKAAWGALALVAIALQGLLFLRDRPRFLQQLPLLVIAGLSSTALALVWLKLFAAHGTWFLQGDGNDMVYFFAGGAWAVEHPLMVPQALVASTFGLGDCRAGVMLVGEGCAVSRSGSYTLMSLLPGVIEGLSPNAARAALGLSGIPLLAGLLPLLWWRGSGTEPTRLARVWRYGVILASVMLMGLCTGIVGSVANGNIGTAFAGAPLVMLALLAFVPCASPALKATVLGLGAAIATHLYGEALVYACVVVAAGVIGDAVRLRRPSWVIVGGAISIALVVLGSNLLLREIHHSLTTIGQIVQAGEWRVWYMNAPPANWLAAPFAGIQMDGQQLVAPLHRGLGLLLAAITIVLSLRKDRWVPAALLAAFSLALVIYLERTGYQYGEHKVVQMLGAIWTGALGAMLLDTLLRSPSPKPNLESQQNALAMVALLAAPVLTVSFLLDSAEALRLRAPERALPRDFTAGLAHVVPGDEVVIDASAVFDIGRYIKQDYVTIGTHLRGGLARLSSRGDGSIPAHSESVRRDSFRGSQSPDWLVRLTDAGHASVFNPQLPATVVVPGVYDLVDLRDGQVGIVLSGDGWHACEPTHCWSAGPYSLEVWTPAGCPRPQLVVSQSFHAAPHDGMLKVSVQGRVVSTLAPADATTVTLDLPAGWSRVEVTPDWPIVSPESLGTSVDPRPLFAAVSSAQVHCGSAAADAAAAMR